MKLGKSSSMNSMNLNGATPNTDYKPSLNTIEDQEQNQHRDESPYLS